MNEDQVHAAFRTARSELRTDEAVNAFDAALVEFAHAAFERGYELGTKQESFRAAGLVGSIRDTRPDNLGRTDKSWDDEPTREEYDTGDNVGLLPHEKEGTMTELDTDLRSLASVKGTRTLEDLASDNRGQHVKDLRLGAAALRFQGTEADKSERPYFFLAAERLEDQAVLVERGEV
jgi:hypothetical protein